MGSKNCERIRTNYQTHWSRTLSKPEAEIVIFISDLGSGGAQRVVSALAQHWVNHNRTVAIVTLSDPKSDFIVLPNKVIRKSLGEYGPSTSLPNAAIQNIRRIWKLRRVLLQLKPVVSIGFIGPAAALLVAATISTNVHTIAAERNDPSKQSFGKIWDLLCYLGYRHADRITTNSTGAHIALSKKYTTKRVTLIPNPIPATSSGPTLSLPGPTILFVGRLHHQKGLDLLLHAFAAMNTSTWHLSIIGEGAQLGALKDMSKQLGIFTRTHFLGALQDPAPYYRSADIFALPSRHEGMPNALLEAMCYGLPVVVSDASSEPTELVENSRGGIITPAEDIEELTQALLRLKNDEMLRTRLGANARKSMDERRQQDKSYQLWDAALEFSSSDDP